MLALWLRSTPLAAEPCVEDLVERGAVRSCLPSGYWAEIKALDNCRFTFAAGLLAPARTKGGHLPKKFHVRGGRCERWPNRPLNAAITSVECARSGNGGAAVTLETAHGVVKKVLAPLPARRVPDEPVLEVERSAPQTEVLSLYRSRDYRLIELGRGCPTCGLFAADIRPTQPDATILNVMVVPTGESNHWFRCPAAFRCGVPEFSPPDQPQLSGCSGQRVCRVWRLSDGVGEARDTVQITYETNKTTCRNCPQGVDYASARKGWEKAKAAGDCQIFPDAPAQVFGEKTAR